jgi:putative ABC transport system ATP-binding protein
VSVLEARGLRYAIGGRLLLADFDLTVGPGERVAVVGPSGSGKTSLLMLLAGLAAPGAGQVLLDGVPVVAGQVPPGVATVLQGHGLVSLLTAAENIEIALFATGTPPARAAAAAQEALASLGLAEHAGQLADELSGGQQQRVAVARALATGPAVLIADEPTAEQDSASRELVLSQMLGLAGARTLLAPGSDPPPRFPGGLPPEPPAPARSLILATHDPEVAQLCDRVVDLADLRPDHLDPSGLAAG